MTSDNMRMLPSTFKDETRGFTEENLVKKSKPTNILESLVNQILK